MTDHLYLTTAIPFVNGSPHLGHALEYVQTDVLARHARARGRAVRFLTGTDEHAAKNVLAARAAGGDVAPFVAANAARFGALADTLGVSYDDFLRTSTDPRHRPAVEELWRRCAVNGDLSRDRYTGWYCAGCEEFRDADADDGRCPEHDARLEAVEEENWFFRLSRYRDAVADLVTSGQLRIEPRARRNEVLRLLAGPVHDLSVSRPRARVHDWGIPVPGDPDQVVYVWFDALTNYVSALGFGGADAEYDEWWDTDGERVHVIGKGIVRFHALIWPAILCSAGLPPPTTLVVHDYVTAGGRKIGKSLGNTVDPEAVAAQFGTDALRWWLCREVPLVGEADFTEERLIEAANRDLANGVGNLVQRTVALAARAFGVEPVRTIATGDLAATGVAVRSEIDSALARYDLRSATAAIIALVDAANRHVDATRPWELLDNADAARATLAPLVHATRTIATELEPFVPELASRARLRVGREGEPVRPGPPVQPRIQTAVV
jgi:methionyl-tRNA synthetase